MTMGKFRTEPRENHVKILEQILGYLRRTQDGATRFRTEIPDHEVNYVAQEMDWSTSVYEGCKEEIPEDAPPPRGKEMRITTYVDANLLHCRATGRSVSGILHLVNSTPIEWFSKKQNVVDAAVYGSEFMTARIATQQIIDLRITLRYMGIKLDGPCLLYTSPSPRDGLLSRMPSSA